MREDLKPAAAMGPYRIELRTNAFRLRRHGDGDDGPGDPEYTDRLFVEHGELDALLAAFMQVLRHPHYAGGLWDTSRSWLSVEAPYSYTPEQIAGANEAWEVSRTRAAVVIAGPLWLPLVYPSGAFAVEVEYARLEGLVRALEAER